MSDNPNTEQEQQTTVVSPTPAEATPTEHMIPKSRFDEVNNKYRDLQAQIEQLQQAKAQEQQQELAEQNRFKELYEQTQAQLNELQQYKAEAESYRQQIEAYNQADIDRIPEDKRHLVPDFGDPVKLREYLNKALPDLIESQKPKAPRLDGGSGSGGNTEAPALSAGVEDFMNIAQNYTGMSLSEERIAQRARNPQKPTDLGES